MLHIKGSKKTKLEVYSQKSIGKSLKSRLPNNENAAYPVMYLKTEEVISVSTLHHH